VTSVAAVPFSRFWRDSRLAFAATPRAAAIADPFMPIYRRGDRVMAWMIAAHLVLAAFLAPIHDTWRVTAIVGIGSALAFYLCMGFAGGGFVTRNVAGLVLQTFCALHIYQMRGLAEMHFFFFTAVTAMIVYQDWRAMWLGVIAIIAQHSLFSLWHNDGIHPGGMTFFEPDRVSLLKIAFHFGIALVQVAFAAWCAHIWRASTERSLALEAAAHRLREREDHLEKTNLRLVHHSTSLEEQLRQSQRMDAVGRLAGAVAHDFNNLLTVIQSHAEFAGHPQASEAERRDDIEQIRRATESGTQLTRQLLAFVRSQPVAPTCIDLNAAVADTLEMVKRLVGEKIEVAFNRGSDLAGIWADGGEIQQVLLNLVVNARDAMPKGGHLRIETANVAVPEGFQGTSPSLMPPGDYVMLSVEDTGTGMTEDVRSHIFEPFFTTKASGHGTGLGLATVARIVRQANGYISAESELGVGTTFKMFFPLYRAVDSM
jgi:signal transduction histidine kinase